MCQKVLECEVDTDDLYVHQLVHLVTRTEQDKLYLY